MIKQQHLVVNNAAEPDTRERQVPGRQSAADARAGGETHGSNAFGHARDTPFGVGLMDGIDDFGPCIGQQMAGFNAVQAIPEPETYALPMSGLVAVSGITRRRRRQGA